MRNSYITKTISVQPIFIIQIYSFKINKIKSQHIKKLKHRHHHCQIQTSHETNVTADIPQAYKINKLYQKIVWKLNE